MSKSYPSDACPRHAAQDEAELLGAAKVMVEGDWTDLMPESGGRPTAAS